jgi:extradiol dioxygenase family protein
MFKKVAFTYYPVTDVARARKLYEETLGLKSGSAGNQGDNWWVEYDLPGRRLPSNYQLYQGRPQ